MVRYEIQDVVREDWNDTCYYTIVWYNGDSVLKVEQKKKTLSSSPTDLEIYAVENEAILAEYPGATTKSTNPADYTTIPPSYLC